MNLIISLSHYFIKNRKDNKAETPELRYCYGTYSEHLMTQLTRNKAGGISWGETFWTYINYRVIDGIQSEHKLWTAGT